MYSDGWLLAGVLAILLVCLSLVGLCMVAAYADRRDERLRAREPRPEPVPCSCEREDLIEVGVDWHPPEAEHTIRALLDVERTNVDEISLFIAPIDGSDKPWLALSRAAADALSEALSRARHQEVANV